MRWLKCMNESIHQYMKIGTILNVSYKWTEQNMDSILPNLKKVLIDPYFECVEISHIQDANIFQSAARMIEESGVVCSVGGQGRMLGAGLNINDLDEGRRALAIDSLKQGIDEAYQIGAIDFQFLAGTYAEETIEDSMQALFRSTEELCAYARKKGDLKIVCEVFDYDVAKKSLIGPADRVKRYAKVIRKYHDNFGIQVDLSHIPILHESIDDSVLPIAKYITHAHIGNAVVSNPNYAAYGDEHPRFGFPNSEVNVEEVAHYLRTLLEIGYLNKKERPIVSFEVKPFGEEDPDIVLANAKRVLNHAWMMV